MIKKTSWDTPKMNLEVPSYSRAKTKILRLILNHVSFDMYLSCVLTLLDQLFSLIMYSLISLLFQP